MTDLKSSEIKNGRQDQGVAVSTDAEQQEARAEEKILESPTVCGAQLSIGDNYGDNEATMICQLPLGHAGWHQESFRNDKAVLRWEEDERRIPCSDCFFGHLFTEPEPDILKDEKAWLVWNDRLGESPICPRCNGNGELPYPVGDVDY
jgi:hypothetical protein